MLMMNGDAAAERARQRDLARRGYDAISLAYRSDDGNAATSSAEDVSRYAGWVGTGQPAAARCPGRGPELRGWDTGDSRAGQLRAVGCSASISRRSSSTRLSGSAPRAAARQPRAAAARRTP